MKVAVCGMFVCVVGALALAGCGGGDDPVGPAPNGVEAAAPLSSSCLPRFEVLNLEAGPSDTYADTVAQMGCEGNLLSEVTSVGMVIRTYDWGRVESGPYVQMAYHDDRLQSWTSQGLLDAAPSTCLPTRAAVDRLQFGMDKAQVDALMGCPGHGISWSLQFGITGSTQIVSWGDVVAGPYLQVTYRLGRLVTLAAQRF